ncbi:unnamed protein product [Protopolystoma xenopodis]|uniref:Uncharacterized protein n=1 Tax=Protopolystoma xenopodis TaxID=117903 RepID=A0A3S5AE89_9PLAT|nr:unnamed protein product [Protopolystoma xenopodis]
MFLLLFVYQLSRLLLFPVEEVLSTRQNSSLRVCPPRRWLSVSGRDDGTSDVQSLAPSPALVGSTASPASPATHARFSYSRPPLGHQASTGFWISQDDDQHPVTYGSGHPGSAAATMAFHRSSMRRKSMALTCAVSLDLALSEEDATV